MNFVYFVLGLCPILWLIFALTVLNWPTYKAAFGSLLISALLSIAIWQQSFLNTATAACEGFLMALWPIIVVIIAAVFTYNLSLRTRGMEIIKQMITSVSSDKRILVLLVAWCFGGFMEGMAGFGTAIAIPASMLVALGFNPLFSCLVCLIANGVPTPFGSIGIPTVTLANLVGLENAQLAFTQTLQLAPFMILCPFLIVMATGKGFKALKGVTLVTLGSALSFLIPQMIVAKFVGAELCVVVGSVCSLLCTILLGSKVKPNPDYEMKLEAHEKITVSKALKAWSPFIFIFIFLLSTSKLVMPVNTYLSKFASSTIIYSGENPSTMTFTWINTPGVWIFLSAILGGLIQKATFRDFKVVFVATLKQMSQTIITMLCVLGCAKIMGYAGMIASIASFAIAITGSFYPFFAPWIGCLGTFVTGSGTSSGVLFGAVQESAAQSLHTNPYWIVALNSLGVAAGKMLSPQSIAIALSSVDGQGQDSKLLSMILPYGVGFIILMSFVAYFGQLIF
ncbi:lactate permease LctP family transporter [uncultured Holdemanella sp.]|uniref:L-lactate permease n=1 Tax=uncultured Holdemanella sp. TaxID=1763549 RepID=UPI002805D92B|nr:lactate permease LctP family transporter [uncultured Holdemanella sp.]